MYESPHSFLGPHDHVVRVYFPDAEKIEIEIEGQKRAMQATRDGVFEIATKQTLGPKEYRVCYKSGQWFHDPYAFAPMLTESDFYHFLMGRDDALYQRLGAHLMEVDGVQGVRFSVWAPYAQCVSLACDLNHFSEYLWPMNKLSGCGVWEIFIPGAFEGMIYKYAIRNCHGHVQMRADPFAFASEKRPSTASMVANIHSALWTDEKWIEQRKNRNHNCLPMNIYEVHLGSWRRRDGQFMNYRDIAVELAQYCKEMHYTHIEMMPITEHPLDESWGYQVTGYFAATSRFGSVQDFQFFMNHMHQEGLFVILDWVGGHFPTDVFALAQFDGSCLYEYSDPQKGFHPHWNTLIFDYGKPQVANFLLASVAYWAEVMHLDGFRLDAVSSMIYLSFGRDPGQWRPNQYGGPENLEAVAFLRQLNTLVHEKFPGVITIAEESSAYPLVSFPISQGGLGFDFKSNLGWMNDTLKYFSTDFPYRAHRHDLITFYLMYAFSEHFALFLSHDEVVHEKRSLIGKMPGNQAQQFANARLLYTMMMTLPGKKLIFMGGEFAQWNEWYEKEEIHWFLLAYPTHQGMQRCVKAINKLYLDVPSFWESDHMPHGFQWIACDDRGGGVISYLRKGGGLEHLVIHNFSQNQYPEYTIHIHTLSSIKEVFNSESELFMGCGLINSNLTVDQGRVNFSLAPFVTAIFEVKFG